MPRSINRATIELPLPILGQLREAAHSEGLTPTTAAIIAVREWLDRRTGMPEAPVRPKQPLRLNRQDGQYHGMQSDGTFIVIDAAAYNEALQQRQRDGMGPAQAELLAADPDSWAPDMPGWISSSPLKTLPVRPKRHVAPPLQFSGTAVAGTPSLFS